jgi:glycosyltransferase involved in cell wall biosynthesis
MLPENFPAEMTDPLPTTRAKPDICVVIPNFNGGRFIRKAIQSVLLNDNLRIQIIVVDDASTDDSITQIEAFGDRLSLIRFDGNLGPNIARNAGLDACVADFVLFLDNDDFLVSGGLPRALDELKGSTADVMIGSFKYASADAEWERQTSKRLETCDGAEAARRWANGDWVPPCAIIWRSTFLRKIGGWSVIANRTNDQDGELIFRASLRRGQFLWSPTNIGVYFQHSGPRTSSLLSIEAMELKYEWLELLMTEARYASADISRALAAYTLNEARVSFSIGYKQVGRRFEQLANSSGSTPKTTGTALHAAITDAIGLERKEQVSRAWRAARSIFRRNVN